MVPYFFFLFLFYLNVNAQNLFANPGFEDLNNCTEHHADCAPEAWFNIPAANYFVHTRIAPKPVSGKMVLTVPVGSVMANFNKPRFVYSAFCCPLVADQKYDLSFFINTANVAFAGLNFYFTEKEPSLFNVNQLIKTPAVTITAENIDLDYKQNWKHVKYQYTATGKEKFCIITTAGLPQVDYEMKASMNDSGDILYFIDDIIFRSQNPAALCSNYAANVKLLYDQNFRHSDNILAFPEVTETRPVFKVSTDTVTISALLFDVGKSIVKPAVKNIVDSLIAKIENKKFLKVEISGHTDNTGDEKSNQLLSESRAAAIKNYITAKLPQFADKIFSFGKGQAYPVAKNDTETGRQKNRRVEIVITYLNIIK